MAEFPFMPFYVEDFNRDPRVRSLTLEDRGVYLLLLGHMWMNDGYLPADYKAIGRIVGVDARTIKKHLKTISPLFHRQTDEFLGAVFTQKRLTRELEIAEELVEKKKAKTANARAALARKKARERLSQDQELWPVTKPQEPPAKPPVSEPVTTLTSHISQQQTASPSRAEPSVAADLAGLGVRHLADELAESTAPVTEVEIAPMVELPKPSASLLNSPLVSGSKPLPASDAKEPAQPRRGLMAALDRAAQKRNDVEN